MIELLLLGAGALLLNNQGKAAPPAAAPPKTRPPVVPPSQAQAAAAERAAIEDDTDVDVPASGAHEGALAAGRIGVPRPLPVQRDVDVAASDLRTTFPGSLRDYQSGSPLMRGLYSDGVRRDVLGRTLTSDGTIT